MSPLQVRVRKGGFAQEEVCAVAVAAVNSSTWLRRRIPRSTGTGGGGGDEGGARLVVDDGADGAVDGEVEHSLQLPAVGLHRHEGVGAAGGGGGGPEEPPPADARHGPVHSRAQGVALDK